MLDPFSAIPFDDLRDFNPQAIAALFPKMSPAVLRLLLTVLADTGRGLQIVKPSGYRQDLQQQLYQLTDAVPSMIAHLDAEERHRYANLPYLKTFGRSLNTLKGESLQLVVGPIVYQQLQDAIKQACTGETAELCLSLISHAQQRYYKHVTVIPERSGSSVSGFYLLLSDITAHKHIKDLLHNQTDHFRYALEGAAVGIWDWNLVTDEIIWSQQQEQLFGLRPGSFDGNPETLFSLVDARDRESLNQALQTALHSPKIFSAEFRVSLSDGSVRWLSHRGQVFPGNEGEPVRLAGVAFDITMQKAAAEKLLQQVRRERLIAQISQEISRSKSLQPILQQVVSKVRTFLGVDRLIIIDLRDKQAGEVTYEDHSEAVRSMLAWKLRHTWIVKEAFLDRYRQGHPVAVNDVRDQRLSDAEFSFLEYFQICADLTVPLLENNELWGLLSVHHSTTKDWQPEDRRLLETLGTQVSTATQRDKLHRELTQANQKLKRFAYLDGLTKVANRRRFEQFLQDEWRRLMREKAPLAIIMADIDQFKAYNDVYGHQAGDECLRRVAGTLSSTIRRPADMVARYGGEEFVVVLPKTTLEGAAKVAEKMRTLVRSQKIPHQGSTSDQIVTLSLGVAVMHPHPLRTPDDLIQAADQALYQAKKEGRDRVVTAQPHD
ncbi:MAG: diguanylate cyclase [Leptolyngbya sp. SIO1E4]|nr:diguanylate cyclase [Leptolyngbya sp. SIO1E4]